MCEKNHGDLFVFFFSVIYLLEKQKGFMQSRPLRIFDDPDELTEVLLQDLAASWPLRLSERSRRTRSADPVVGGMADGEETSEHVAVCVSLKKTVVAKGSHIFQ